MVVVSSKIVFKTRLDELAKRIAVAREEVLLR